ncbi:MAG: CDP-alcohol phosphatidyltransferase family protein [Phycisphaerae bacterium]
MSYEPVKVWRSLTWPNRISIGRLLLIPPFIVLLLNQGDWWWARGAAGAVFVIMGLSDAVDGFLARRLDLQTRLGAILDPLADKLLIVSAVTCLSVEGSAVPGFTLPNWVVVAVIGKDLWVIIGFTVVYLVTDRFRVHPTWAGKASTACQLVLVVSVLLLPEINALRGGLGTQIAWAMTWVVTIVSILAMISYTRLGLQYVLAEQKPLDHHEDREPAGQTGSNEG